MSSPPSPCVPICDDFDDAEHMKRAYCKLVSEAEFEEDIATETDKALGELCLYLDQNPEEYARILRKRKKEELENDGFFSLVKSKVMSLVHGEEYPECLVSTGDCIQQTHALKAGMCKAFQYSQNTKGTKTRHSLRQEAKKLSQQGASKGTAGSVSASSTAANQSKAKITNASAAKDSGDAVCNKGKCVHQKGDGKETHCDAGGNVQSTDCMNKGSTNVSVPKEGRPGKSDQSFQCNVKEGKAHTMVMVAPEPGTVSAPAQPPPPPPPPPPPLPPLLPANVVSPTVYRKASVSPTHPKAQKQALVSITNSPCITTSTTTPEGQAGTWKDTPRPKGNRKRRNSHSSPSSQRLIPPTSENKMSKASHTVLRPGSGHSVDGPFLTPMVNSRLRNHKRSLSNSSIGSYSSVGSVSSVHSELMLSNPVTRLRATEIARSPGGTPVRPAAKDRLPSEPLHKALVSAMRSKFKNVHTPSPRSGNASFNNSGVGNTSSFSP